MGEAPEYVSVVFIITTFAAVAFLLQAVKAASMHSTPAKVLLFVIPFWIMFQVVLASSGFYRVTDTTPPRLMTAGILPPLILVLSICVIYRSSFIDQLPLSLLTLVHSVRTPVEIVLYWLFISRLVPREMTFTGWNFDALSGIFAITVYVAVFRFAVKSRALLAAFNVVGLLLLLNIVSIALLSVPTPFQRIGFDQPNMAVLLFPYILLPTVVVPIVLFSHVAALVKICKRNGTLR